MQEEEETPENEAAVAMGHTPTSGRPGAVWLHWVWALMSSRKGCAGNFFTKPFKAFAVTSLYVGSVATVGVVEFGYNHTSGFVCEEPVQSATASAQNAAPSGFLCLACNRKTQHPTSPLNSDPD
ncbi:hypothetical protein ACFX13_032491 [Malus domestica]